MFWFCFLVEPKIAAVGNGEVHVTINEELLDFKLVGIEHGVPVIAGCPNASSFWELANCRDFVWIDIAESSLSLYLIPISSPKKGSCWLTEKSIIQMIKKSAVLNLSSFEEFLREAQASQPDNGYGGHYKPVYFLIQN